MLASLLIVVFGRYGFPPTLARKAYDAFGTTRLEGTDLNSRLFSLSSNGRTEYWHTAWQQASTHPVLGDGAGTYDEFWFQNTRIGGTVHDAHNLYLETLAELGPIGLALLIIVVAAPLSAIRRARSSPLAAAAGGGFVAFLLHAAADWDWEMPAVTLTGLFCAIALLAAGRRHREARTIHVGVRLTALAGVASLFVFGLLGLLGNSAVSASSKSTDSGHFARAESEAHTAMRYVPWSPEPWRKLGEAQRLSGDVAAARLSFRMATQKDPRDWTLWYELALASRGVERQEAFAEASRLNPHDDRLTSGASG